MGIAEFKSNGPTVYLFNIGISVMVHDAQKSQFGGSWVQWEKSQMHKDPLLFIYFEQTVQLSNTGKILCLGTEVTFCPLQLGITSLFSL